MSTIRGEPDFSPRMTVLVLFPDGPKYVPAEYVRDEEKYPLDCDPNPAVLQPTPIPIPGWQIDEVIVPFNGCRFVASRMFGTRSMDW